MPPKNSTSYKAIILDTDKVLSEGESLNRARTLNDRAISILVELAEYVRWGSRWSRAGEHVADTYDSIIRQLLIDAPPMKTETVKEVLQYIQTHHEEVINEELGMRQQYQKFNGIWYIGFDCGDCGEVAWIPLGAAATIDPSTSAPVTPEQGSVSITTPSAQNQPCYATASVDYLLNRFRQWLNFGLGSVTTAIDESFGVFDDVVSVAAQFLSKSDERSLWDALIEQGEDEIYAQVAQHRSAYIANFDLEAPILAEDVRGLFTDEVGTWTLAGQAIIAWIKTSKLLGITKDLQKLANDCEANAGTSQLAPLLPDATPSLIWLDMGTEANGALNRYEYNAGYTFTGNEESFVIPQIEGGARISAVAIYGDGSGAYNDNWLRVADASELSIVRTQMNNYSATTPIMIVYLPDDVYTLEPTLPAQTGTMDTRYTPLTITSEIWPDTEGMTLDKVVVWTLV
mgnify:CR=1 FL=1